MNKGILQIYAAVAGMLGSSGVGVGNVQSSGLYSKGYTIKAKPLSHQIKRREKVKRAKAAKKRSRRG